LTGMGGHRHDRIGQARDRLANAVARLEQACEATDGAPAVENGELERLRETHAALDQRLDSAIGRLHGLLNG